MHKLLLVAASVLSVSFVWCAPLQAGSCAAESCHAAVVSNAVPHQPVKDMECDSCHKPSGPKHPGGTPFTLVAKGAALCLQCHSPFGKVKNVHEPVKGGECLECHRPHGGKGKFLLEQVEDLTPLCTKCHEAAPFKQKFQHGPAALGLCTRCHNPHESAEKSLTKGPVRTLCLSCHDELARSLAAEPVIHKPVQSGVCSTCHDPHGTQFKGLLRKKIPQICIECHAGIGKRLAGVKTPHKPLLEEGGCSTCHAPHFARAKGLLQGDEKSVCLGCHGRDDLGKPALSNMAKELDKKKFLHGPLRKGECKACHDPHGSDNFRMLNGSYPATTYVAYKEGSYDFCLKCHDKNLLRFAESTLYTGFRNGSRNLHYVHVTDKRKGRSCRICHEPHAGNGEKLIRTEGVKFGDWRIPINFKITTTGGSCAPGCHQAYSYDREKPVKY